MGNELMNVEAIQVSTNPQKTSEMTRYMTPLHLAAMIDNTIALTSLIKDKSSLEIQNHYGDTALHAAASCGSFLRFGKIMKKSVITEK